MINNKLADKDILQAMLVPNHRWTYAIGCFDKRITIYSQQIRAFNLAYALIKEQVVKKDSSVAIIGGGIAGITIAAALCADTNVFLFERMNNLCYLQRGDNNRYIHPNIYDWPLNDEYKDDATELPFMNWSAGSGDHIVRQLDVEFNKFKDRIRIFNNREVVQVQEKSNKVELSFIGTGEFAKKTYPKLDFKTVIYAGGFGIEQQKYSTNPENSYWRCEALHQEQLIPTENGKRYAIVGTGDGGTIDCARAYSNAFDQGKFIKATLADHHILKFVHEMARIDKSALEAEMKHKSDPPASGEPFEMSEFLYEQYSEIYIEPGLIEKTLKGGRRNDKPVKLYGLSKYPLSLDTALINRYFIFILLRNGSIEYHQKKFDRNDKIQLESEEFHVIDRRGPVPAYSTLFKTVPPKTSDPDDLLNQLCKTKLWETELDFFQHTLPADEEVRISIFYDKRHKNYRQHVSHITAEIRALGAHIGSRFAFAEYHIEASPTGVASNVDHIKSCLQSDQSKISILLSSNCLALGHEILSNKRNLIMIGGSRSMNLEYPILKEEFPALSILGIYQKIKMDKVIKYIALAFPGERIGFVCNSQFPFDIKFFAKMADCLHNHAEHKDAFELVRIDVSGPTITNEMHSCKVLTGRLFVHLNGGFFYQNKPFISCYESDEERGAIMTLSNWFDDTAKKVVEYGIREMIEAKPAVKHVKFIKEPVNYIIPRNAAKFGITFNEAITYVSRKRQQNNR
ncbi:hypothetical protein HHL16_12980 [Pseudoflavitalea sp. G-6-1-2]|uniref:hypothetical protein n=1 Tax=Pseudoflavitalea sp. G-6-1-2 TaxID=2728841 RepID=UPI00146DBD54|nr:hypothetical protein [Pseudoflavitalea sp. G-6-1-2]NML21797.1 hypothetical protein [Pseudoflavitalea sp. G-6-1-2]